MPKASALQFNNYSVEELYFKNVPVLTEQQQFDIPSRFKQDVIDLGDNNYDIKLSFDITPTEEHPMPFELRVTMVGHFSYNSANGTDEEKAKECILRRNTISILFPFLRSIVATLTTTANVPTLVLPIMDFSGTIKKD